METVQIGKIKKTENKIILSWTKIKNNKIYMGCVSRGRK